jgi:hypothetical protein
MKKLYIAALSFVFAGALSAQNANVTFQVDMTGQTVSTNGLHVAGDFQTAAGGSNWTANGTPMTQVGTTNIYEATVNIPHGQYEFKFINDNTFNGVESVPADCQKEYGSGNDNRVVNIFSDTTLAAIKFGECAPDGLNYVMFRVDMSNETVSPNGVHVAGAFQAAAGFAADWQPNTTRMFDVNGNDIFVRAVYIPAGTYEYKFVNDTAWTGAETVPAACQVNTNREMVVAGSTLLPVTEFGQCPAGFVPPTRFNVTYRVDMSTTCIPFDSVDIAGGAINGWSGGDNLMDMGNGIYEGSFLTDSGNVVFKFRALVAGSPNWEGIPDRAITVNGDTTLPLACFNVAGFNACPAVPDPADVTFRVDLSNEIPAANIYVIGDFTVPAWQGGAIPLTPSPGNPGVFETTVTDLCPGSFFYKFVNGDVNNSANEETFSGGDTLCVLPSGVGGYNRFHERTNNDPVTLQYVFGTCTQLTISTEDVFADQNIGISPNPITEVGYINLSDKELYNVSLRDLNGRVVRDMKNVNGRVSIQRNGLSSGMYILQITNQKGEVNNSKVSFN